MEGKSIVVCVVAGTLGLISTAMGLAFEAMPDKRMVKLFYFTWNYDDYCTDTNCGQYDCVYFRSAAFFLVLAAIVCVFVAQIIISIASDCGCCSGVYSSSASQALATLAFCFSWLACIAAIITWLVGGAKQGGVQFPNFDHFLSSLGSIWVDRCNCYKVKHGVFGAAAALSFGAATLGIVSYVTSVKRRRRFQGARMNNIEPRNHGDVSY